MTKRVPQVQFFLPKDDMARAAERAAEFGVDSVNKFSKSIVLLFLDGELVPAEMSSDARNVAQNMASVVERIEALARQSAARDEEIKKLLVSMRANIDEATSDTFDQVTKLIGVAARIDKTTDYTIKLLRELSAPPDESGPSVSSLSEPVDVRSAKQEVWSSQDRRSGNDTGYTGPERRSGDDRRAQPRNGAEFFAASQES